ncbi:MAG: hypothetical protein QM756_11655 [Polyangiaceae bacterium]
MRTGLAAPKPVRFEINQILALTFDAHVDALLLEELDQVRLGEQRCFRT